MKLTPQKLLIDLGIRYSEKTNRLSMCCPFHPDRDPSSGFYLDTDLFHCFSCEITYDLLTFYAKYKELSRAQAEAELEKKYGEVPEKKPTNRMLITPIRARAERILMGKKSLGRVLHARHAERLDKILWVYEHGTITEAQLSKVMDRWYSEIEGKNVPEQVDHGVATIGSDDRVQEGVCPVPGSGPEDGAVDLD